VRHQGGADASPLRSLNYRERLQLLLRDQCDAEVIRSILGDYRRAGRGAAIVKLPADESGVSRAV